MIAFIMSVYNKSLVEQFSASFNSIKAQEDVAIDFLLNIDGPIHPSLESFISGLTPAGAIRNIKIYRSDKNRGLAASMNRLILEEFANYEYFLRQDCDDYSALNRCKLQIKFLEANPSVDSVGTYFQSFNFNKFIEKKTEITTYPIEHLSISRQFAFQAPVAHATICFRKSFFIKAGIYSSEHSTFAEDSRLWYAGFYTGCIFANIPEVLYFVSESESQFKRRSGFLQILTIFKVRVRYIVHARLGILFLLPAIAEFFLRLLLSIILLLPFKETTNQVIMNCKKLKNYALNKK